MKRTTCRGGRRPPAYPVHMRLGVGCVGLRAAAGRPSRRDHVSCEEKSFNGS